MKYKVRVSVCRLLGFCFLIGALGASSLTPIVKADGNGDLQTLADAAASAKEDPTVSRILIAVRRMVEGKFSGRDGLNFAAQAIVDARAALRGNDRAALDRIATLCESTVSSSNRSSMTADEQLLYLDSNTKYSVEVRHFLKQFVRPTVICYGMGLQGMKGVFLMLSAKAQVSVCLSTNGRRWLEASAGLGVGYGFGAAAFVTGGDLTRIQNYFGFPVSVELTEQSPDTYVLVAKYNESEKDWDERITKAGASPVTKDEPYPGTEARAAEQVLGRGSMQGLGCGFLLFGKIPHAGQVNVKVLPFGTSRSFLAEQFNKIP